MNLVFDSSLECSLMTSICIDLFDGLPCSSKERLGCHYCETLGYIGARSESELWSANMVDNHSHEEVDSTSDGPLLCTGSRVPEPTSISSRAAPSTPF